MSGELPPGQRLVELQLSDRYKAGRAAIRLALVELGKEGLVERTTNRGASVRRLTLEQTIEIIEVRMELESLVARHAAKRATANERSELKEIVQRMRHSALEDDHVAYARLNKLLHGRLSEISRHYVAVDLVDNLRNRAAHQQYRLAMMPGRIKESLDQHAAIVDAIVNANPDAADEAIRNHLKSMIRILEAWTAAGVRA